MTKPIIVVKVPCKLLYVIQVKEFLIKCSTSWPYLISEFLVAYITIVASDWPRTFFTPKVFLFSIVFTHNTVQLLTYPHYFQYYRDTIAIVACFPTIMIVFKFHYRPALQYTRTCKMVHLR